ncbi:MAG: FecR domain-containing protein [Verrucomicrobia bacterium]|nr:FecR domain-containing protein [Verrucomicrobiota bacterium]
MALLGWLALVAQAARLQGEEVGAFDLRTNTQPATINATEGAVLLYRGGLQPPQRIEPPQRMKLSRTNAPPTLEYQQQLQTLLTAWASLTLADQTTLRVWEMTRLYVVHPASNSAPPKLNIEEGEIHVNSRGAREGSCRVDTPYGTANPQGTEYVVSVDPLQRRTQITLFDGEADISNGRDHRVLKAGEQGTLSPGRQIEVRSIQASNIVQWWIYYPAVLDPEELPLTAEEKARAAESLAAYRSGSLAQALRNYPGYPQDARIDTDGQAIYYAALLLSVGSVRRAESALQRVNTNAPLARALRTMVEAVSVDMTGLDAPGKKRRASPSGRRLSASADSDLSSLSASEWIAVSYSHQATNNLEAAVESSRRAVERSPGFGFGWARLGELEFSFGRLSAARSAMEKALVLSPSNAPAHALQGFLLAGENRWRQALASFDRAIQLDARLANAWLGRGLCKRRLAWREPRRGPGAGRGVRPLPDWLSDLSTAVSLEPTRSLVRSYMGKGFAEVGEVELAEKELAYAKALDANDPTPWLYSAFLRREENRVNEAVYDLEQSIERNDNRAVYRSRLLLDEDRAVRSSSLASLYRDAGMNRLALAEAASAVSADYANYSAHQFLAESYNTLRDPTRFNLRYETVWFNELLLANLLSPPGATPLSQHVSQQEYSRLFEHNRVGLTTDSSYRSDGQYRELSSQFGVVGNMAWSLDLDYQRNDGSIRTISSNERNGTLRSNSN